MPVTPLTLGVRGCRYRGGMAVLVWFRFIVTILIGGGVLLASIIAMVDAARVPESAFVDADNRTKKFWLLLLGGGLVVAILGALQMVGIMLNLIAIAPAAAYWYGVRHLVKPGRFTSGARSSRFSVNNLPGRGPSGSGRPSLRGPSGSGRPSLRGPSGSGRPSLRRRPSGGAKLSPLDSQAAGNPNDPRFDL